MWHQGFIRNLTKLRESYSAVYVRVREHQTYLELCSKDERSFYGFGTTWG